MTIIQIPVNSLEVQLTGEKTTTPAVIEFSYNGLGVRFDGIDRYFEVDFKLLPGGDLVMVIRDYHNGPDDKPEVRLIHSWAEQP